VDFNLGAFTVDYFRFALISAILEDRLDLSEIRLYAEVPLIVFYLRFVENSFFGLIDTHPVPPAYYEFNLSANVLRMNKLFGVDNKDNVWQLNSWVRLFEAN
jgi:hypothetical protein